jgi:hypothetical protein
MTIWKKYKGEKERGTSRRGGQDARAPGDLENFLLLGF